jgi:hypothetical protein
MAKVKRFLMPSVSILRPEEGIMRLGDKGDRDRELEK